MGVGINFLFFFVKTVVYWKKSVQYFLLKCCPSLSTTFLYLFDKKLIFLRKHNLSFEVIHESTHMNVFEIVEVLLSKSKVSIRTSGNQMEQCLKNTVGGSKFPIWEFLNTFKMVLQSVAKHCLVGKSPCRVFSVNCDHFSSNAFSIWWTVSSIDLH